MAKATVMAVVNQKGGTGKTTTCENLGVGLAMECKKVLLVDTDPQASLTICLGHPVPDQLSPTLSDMMGKILSEQPIAPGEGILHHPEGVDLIPANIELSGLEVSKQIIGSSTFTALAESLKLPERRTMGAKLERLGAELAKARKKKAEWDSRVKDLERRYREEENSEIHEMVHAANLTPDQLSELLKMFAEDSAPKPETIQSVTEEETTHEN